MFGTIKTAAAALGIAVLALSAAHVANAQMAGDAVEARKELMKSNGKNMKAIGAYVKSGAGSPADVAKSARTIASNMAQFANYFPEGTAQGAGAAKTRAKAEIWTSWAKFVDSTAKATQLAMDVSAAAESGDKGAIANAAGALGKGCGGCHKAWRGPKN